MVDNGSSVNFVDVNVSLKGIELNFGGYAGLLRLQINSIHSIAATFSKINDIIRYFVQTG